ncbi:hypothetical protein T459_13957 [Capsicum annuum]|uniref:Retrotransposon gag domain-containing protein n=1 Tax=Capsicum annuum TaxID=4072 RepID=A0A2G2ZG16_CAPAN|nr:hypothetical protein T459_13957 [Capsicum annuum]
MIRYRVILKKIAVEKNRVVEIAVDKFCILLVTPRKKGAHQEAGKRREREEVIKTGTGTGVEIETEIKKGTKIGIGIGIGTERGRRTVIVITEIVIGIGVIGERERTRDRDEDDLHRIRDYDRISGFDMAPPSSPLLPGATDVTGLNATSYGSARKLQRLTAPLPFEAPAFNVNPTVVIPYSISDSVLNIFSDRHYAPEKIFKSTGPYDCPQPPEFSPKTEKPVMTEEQEKIARKLRSLKLTMKNLQGLGGYKSVSYKDLCMFPGVHLPLGFKMPKFEKYDGHGDPVAHLRCYFNQLRGVGGKEELIMAYFGESLSGLASEWFVDQDIDKWSSWDDLANEFIQQF